MWRSLYGSGRRRPTDNVRTAPDGSGRLLVGPISCDNSETVCEIGCQLLLITNRKSHTSFRLIPTSMTLNDLERHNSPYFAFFHRIRLLCWPVTSHWLKIDLMSVKYCLPVPVFHFPPYLTHPAARYVCDSWATCFCWPRSYFAYGRFIGTESSDLEWPWTT